MERSSHKVCLGRFPYLHLLELRHCRSSIVVANDVTVIALAAMRMLPKL